MIIFCVATDYSLLTIPYSLRSSLSVIHPSDCYRAPAAGYRHNTTGAYTPDGYGDYWSSSSAASGNNRAGYLAFNSANVNPLNTYQRACGFPVRCVQHLPAAFRTPETPARAMGNFDSRFFFQ